MINGEKTSTIKKFNVSWNKKKTVKSIAIKGNRSYDMWTSDFKDIPLTISYTDGTNETLTNWTTSYSIVFPGENIDDLYDDEYKSCESYEMTTANQDKFYLCMIDGAGEAILFSL